MYHGLIYIFVYHADDIKINVIVM